MAIERISIELTNNCSKGCWFCYNHSQPGGATVWQVEELISFVKDCAENGIRAVSFGGGEPLQYEGLFDLLNALKGVLFRSLTTNGLHLHGTMFDRLIAAQPDKVHVSIHFPDRIAEITRVIGQVRSLEAAGIKSGVNLLVMRSQLADARLAAQLLHESGIGNDRIVYLPRRGQDTPSPNELAEVAGGTAFQSMTCLTNCGPSPRFVSIGWDQSVAWCSYTQTRRPLASLTFQAIREATQNLGLEFCGKVVPTVSRRISLSTLPSTIAKA